MCGYLPMLQGEISVLLESYDLFLFLLPDKTIWKHYGWNSYLFAVEINVGCFILLKFRFIKKCWSLVGQGRLTLGGFRSNVHLEHYIAAINHVEILFTYFQSVIENLATLARLLLVESITRINNSKTVDLCHYFDLFSKTQ